MVVSALKMLCSYLIATILAITVMANLFYLFEKNQRIVLLLMNLPHFHFMADRLAFTLRLQVFSLLMIMVIYLIFVINKIFRSENLNAIIKINTLLINSIEQLVLTLVSQLILSTYLLQSEMKLIVLINIYYNIGRIFYSFGYYFNFHIKKFGSVLSILPTFITIVLNTFYAFHQFNYLLPMVK